ncbi:MAG: D-tyrosyl-tRNA(Tyr) deacylase [Fluviicola sp.]|nr:D-tyrosyl-tRNA(Tyr) deacylase [Fluviicola sp.]
MKVVLQRITEASVSVDGAVIGEVAKGILVLLGIAHEDEKVDADWLVKKITDMRIFSDVDGKMNLSAKDINGEFLVISQFTLQASTKKGNRPSYIKAARPEVAIPLYEYFIEQLRKVSQAKVATGEFGADMQVSLVNDGPVTIVLDTKEGS